jgi:hypothetical protein
MGDVASYDDWCYSPFVKMNNWLALKMKAGVNREEIRCKRRSKEAPFGYCLEIDAIE